MKVMVLYRPNSETARSVEEFSHELEREYQAKIDLVSLDTRDGSSTASLYGVVQYPAVLVLGADGQLVKDWQGAILPLRSEIAYYIRL